MGALSLDRMKVLPGRMLLELSWDASLPGTAPEVLVDAALERYPTIRSHSCVNDRGPSFGHVMRSTSIPHLLEHIIIEEQLERMLAAGLDDDRMERIIVGTTTMHSSGTRAKVEVSFIDDLIAAKSAAAAMGFIDRHL